MADKIKRTLRLTQVSPSELEEISDEKEKYREHKIVSHLKNRA